MSTKHTPGPWHVVDLGRETGGLWVSCGTDKYSGVHPDGSYLSICVEACGLANARLIAAAPDMLAALRDAQKRLRGAGMLGGEDDPVNAALTKAEGRS